MSQVPEKKSEQILMNVVPSMYRNLLRIAEKEDRPLGYVARELISRGLALYLKDSKLRDNDPVTNNVQNAVDQFDLEAALARSGDPEAILNEWFAFEGRSLPADLMIPQYFGGWESFSHEERLDALRDVKKVLDRAIRNNKTNRHRKRGTR